MTYIHLELMISLILMKVNHENNDNTIYQQ